MKSVFLTMPRSLQLVSPYKDTTYPVSYVILNARWWSGKKRQKENFRFYR